MSKNSMRSIPAAAAMAAALLFGAQVHAQSTLAPGINNTNKDITSPAAGSPAIPARAETGFDAQLHAQSTVAPSVNNTNKDITSPAAGSPRVPARTDAGINVATNSVGTSANMNTNQAAGATGDGGTTAIPGVMPKDSEQRTAEKDHKKSMKIAKNAAKKSVVPPAGAAAGGSASATSADSVTTDTKK